MIEAKEKSTDPTCKVIKQVCVDAHVDAEFPVKWWEYAKWVDNKRIAGTPEDLGRCLEAKCKEFEDFLRDHRSQDMVQLTVVRDLEDQCSHCHSRWEADRDGDVIRCASCGAIVEEQP
jgi:hypothetical protein